MEAVCDRVGILRAGRLVEVAGLADLRRLRMTELTATFGHSVPPTADLADLAGVEAVRSVWPRAVTLVLSGPPGPVLRRLATDDLVGVDAREPSLEEIFLEYYGRADS